jgi:hypothetical protein
MVITLAELYKGLHPQVLQAHVRWAQFLALFTVSDDRTQFIFRVAPWFFRLVQDTFRDDAFISLSRLTDRSQTAGKANLTLESLVDAAEASGQSALASAARALLAQLLVQVESIRIWRNKWLGHTDLAAGLASPPLPTAKVQRGDIDEALRLTREIMGLFAAHQGQLRYGYDSVIVIGDAKDLLKALGSP